MTSTAIIRIVGQTPKITRAVVIVSGSDSGGGGVDNDLITVVAGAPFGGEVALQWTANGQVVPSSSADAANAASYAGISTQAASAAGVSIQMRLGGLMTQSFWNWTPALPIFRGINGALTQTPPTTGVIQQVASVVTPTSIFVRPSPPTIRS